MKLNFPGLTNQEVETARTQQGTNSLTTMARETFWDKLLNNIKDPIIIILIFALGITVLLMILGYTDRCGFYSDFRRHLVRTQ